MAVLRTALTIPTPTLRAPSGRRRHVPPPPSRGLTGLYLSGGARVGTRTDTESLGPRSHIVGVIDGLRREQVDVDTLIVGDRSSPLVAGPGSDRWLQSGRVSRLAADAGRQALRWRSRREVAQLLDRRPYDFVYERYSLYQDLGAEAVKRRVPWVLEVNALLSLEASRHRRATSSLRLAHQAERAALRRADLLVCVSEPLAEMLLEAHRVPQDLVYVLPNGVDAERFERCAPVRRTGPDLVVGFVGALYAWQDLDLLLRAVHRDPTGRLRVRIAGGGVAGARLAALVEELGLQDRVELVGRVAPPDVPAFLDTVDLGFAGHRVDSGTYFSPLKVWEYLAAGRPVLASRHATTEALAAEGFALEMFTGGDVDDLHAGLLRCLAAKESLATQAEATRGCVGREHSWQARVRTLLDELDRRGLVRTPVAAEATAGG